MRIRKNNVPQLKNEKNNKKNYLLVKKKIYLFEQRKNSPANDIATLNSDKFSLGQKSNGYNKSDNNDYFSMPKTTRSNYKRKNFDCSTKDKESNITIFDDNYKLNSMKQSTSNKNIKNKNIEDFYNNSMKTNTPMIKTKKIIFKKNDLFQINSVYSNLYVNNNDYKNQIINEMCNGIKNPNLTPNNLFFDFYNKNVLLNSTMLNNYNSPFINQSNYDDKINNLSNNNLIDEKKIRLLKIEEIEKKIKIEENKLIKLKEEKNNILNSNYIFESMSKSRNNINTNNNPDVNKNDKVNNTINNLFNNSKFIKNFNGDKNGNLNNKTDNIEKNNKKIIKSTTEKIKKDSKKFKEKLNLKFSTQIFKSYSKPEFKGFTQRSNNNKQKNNTKKEITSSKNLKNIFSSRKDLFSSKIKLQKKTSKNNINMFNKKVTDIEIYRVKKLINNSISSRIMKNAKKNLSFKSITTTKRTIILDLNPIIKNNGKNYNITSIKSRILNKSKDYTTSKKLKNISPINKMNSSLSKKIFENSRCDSYKNVKNKTEYNSQNISNIKNSSIMEKSRCKNMKSDSIYNKIYLSSSKKKTYNNLSKKQSIKNLIRDANFINNSKIISIQKTTINL